MGSPTLQGVCGKCVGKGADAVLDVPQRSVNSSSYYYVRLVGLPKPYLPSFVKRGLGPWLCRVNVR